MGQKWAEPVRKPILDIGRFAGVETGIFWEYSLGSAQLGRLARLAIKRLGVAQYTASVWLSCLLPRGASDARGIQWQTFKRRVWDTSCSDYVEFCTSEFVWMNSTRWNDQKVFLTTLKNQVYPKNSSVF
jgi:hypothetical protein